MTHPRISLICLFWFIIPPALLLHRFNSTVHRSKNPLPPFHTRTKRTEGGGGDVSMIGWRSTIEEIGWIKRRNPVWSGIFLLDTLFSREWRTTMEEIGRMEDRRSGTKLIRHFIFLSTFFPPFFWIFWIFFNCLGSWNFFLKLNLIISFFHILLKINVH